MCNDDYLFDDDDCSTFSLNLKILSCICALFLSHTHATLSGSFCTHACAVMMISLLSPQVSEYMSNNPNGLACTRQQPGNISAEVNLYATNEALEMVVFVGEWESKADYVAYVASEGRTNESWQEISKLFAPPSKFLGMEPMGGQPQQLARDGKNVGFVVLIEMSMLPDSVTKASDFMLHDPNGLKYTTKQKGNISATSNLYTTEEGVETIVFFSKWESMEDFVAQNDSEGRQKELAVLFVGLPVVTLMRPLGTFAVASDTVPRLS